MQLTKEKIKKIREMLPQGSNKAIAIKAKTSPCIVSNTLNGKLKSSPTTLKILEEALNIISNIRTKEDLISETAEKLIS